VPQLPGGFNFLGGNKRVYYFELFLLLGRHVIVIAFQMSQQPQNSNPPQSGRHGSGFVAPKEAMDYNCAGACFRRNGRFSDPA
jgi:hypothetical protein